MINQSIMTPSLTKKRTTYLTTACRLTPTGNRYGRNELLGMFKIPSGWKISKVQWIAVLRHLMTIKDGS